MSNKLLAVLSIKILLILISLQVQALPIDFKWVSRDKSLVTVKLSADGEFFWRNADGSLIRLTGGRDGASFTLRDMKNKRGKVSIDPTVLMTLANPNFGNNPGDMPVQLAGQIDSGQGMFEMSFEGFNEIDDMAATFFADLVSDGTDNPLNLGLLGQGDQTAFATPGTVDYSTKWQSDDSVSLSNGQQLDIGSFFLLGDESFLGDIADYQLSYNFSGDENNLNFGANFTTGQKYVFTNDDFTGERFSLTGTVTKDINPVPLPASIWFFLTGVAIVARIRYVGLTKKP